jgi:hypothetical protein
LLCNRNHSNDYEKFKQIKKIWNNSLIPLQIILFPEGTIYSKKKINSNEKQILDNFNIPYYKNVLFPKTFFFNLNINEINIKYIYKVNILYKLKNKRIFGEYNIFKYLMHKDFEIIVSLDKFKNENIDDKWLYNQWNETDKWIDKYLK